MNTMSPTAQAVVETSKIRDAAMQAAYDAENTPGEAAADAAYQEACKAHRAARRAHGDNV